IPKYTHLALAADLLQQLATHANIRGVKDSSGDVKNLAAYRDAVPHWTVLAGSGSLLFAGLELGCDGGVLAVACYAARRCADIFAAFRAGDRDRAGAREILKRELGARGFVVLEQRFRSRPRAPLWGRAASDAVNLIAVRPRARVTAWLTAHYDSKGQPVSMAARLVLAGVVVAG